jgi:hypothetical protein
VVGGSRGVFFRAGPGSHAAAGAAYRRRAFSQLNMPKTQNSALEIPTSTQSQKEAQIQFPHPWNRVFDLFMYHCIAASAIYLT